MVVSKKTLCILFNLIPLPLLQSGEGEKTVFMGGFKSPLQHWRGDLGVRFYLILKN
jgi:hypothetical protein